MGGKEGQEAGHVKSKRERGRKKGWKKGRGRR